jgi:tRNA1Val (adenine37-N6)-methyltransferase
MEAACGIVRGPRRPAGWLAPGPRPPAGDAAALGPRPGEDLCYLAGEWRILQHLDGHRWSLDDLVTAWVAADELGAEPPGRMVDLGCGIGTVLLLLAWRWPGLRAVGIEAQGESVDLARRSLVWNGAEARCVVRHADFRDRAALAGLGGSPLVTGTPPYLPRAAATASPHAQRAHCRLELAGGVEEYVRAAGSLLGPSGRFVMCAAVRQHARVAAAASAAGLGALRRLDVVPRAGKSPLFSVHVLGREAAGERLEPPLVVRDEYGRRTPAVVAVRAAFGMPP